MPPRKAKKMPLGVANDWRVERSLVGTWKSSVPLHGSLNRAKKRRNLRVRTLNQKSQRPVLLAQGHLHSGF